MVGAVLMAAPSPEGSLRRSAWQEKTAQAEFHAWAEGVRSAGIDVTDAEFEEFLWTVGSKYVDIKRSVLTPYSAYSNYSGARQGWRMFVAPHRNPSTLNIDVEVPDQNGLLHWETVYGSRDGIMDADESYKGQWRAYQFRHNRMAKTVFLSAWSFRRSRYEEFSHWIAEVAAKDFPTATRVRTRLFEYRTLTPEEVRAGQREKGAFKSTKIFNLEEIRARQASDGPVIEALLAGSEKERRKIEKQSEATRIRNERREASKAERRRKIEEANRETLKRRQAEEAARTSPPPAAEAPATP